VVGEVAGYLADSISVNLVGMKGSGRSTVALSVADRLQEQGFTVVPIFGVAALRDRSLAALAASRVDVPLSPSGPTIAGAVAALTKRLEGRSVLVVDDADELDSASVGAIVAAHVHQQFPIFAVTRPAGLAAATSLLGDVGQSVLLQLPPLQFDELHRAVHALLPGSVDPSAVAQIATLCGGLPRLMNAIVDTGRRTGALAEANGVWRVKRSLWDERLAQVVEPLLSDLTGEELPALTRMAAGGPLPMPDALEVLQEGHFERLRELGLLQVEETAAGRQVMIHPPLVSEYLRRTAVAAYPQGEPGGDELGATVVASPLTSSRVAIINLRIAEHWQAEADTLRAVWREQPSADNAAQLIAALNGVASRPEEIAAIIDGTKAEAGQPCVARFASWQAAHLALQMGDRDGARAVLHRCRAALPEFSTQLRAADGMLQMLTGVIPDDGFFDLTGATSGDEYGQRFGAVHRLALALDGRTRDALAGGLDPTLQGDYFAETNDVAIGLARVLHGDFAAAVGWVLRAMAAAEDRLNPGELQAYAFVAALGLALSGRLAELQALLGPALALNNTTMLQLAYQSGLLSVAAQAAQWSGQQEYGESLSAQAGAVTPDAGPFTTLVRAPEGSADGAAQWRAVRHLLSTGQTAGAVMVAVDAVETLTDAGLATVVAERARGTQSPFLMALGDYILAAGQRDAGALKKSVDELWRLGARPHAVGAAVTLALVLRENGDMRGFIEASEDAWTRAGELGRPCPGLFHRLGRAVDLSAREREVGLALARDETPADIAADLNLSLRTIENYLSSAYRKLGSDGRADLARAVSTWASQPDR